MARFVLGCPQCFHRQTVVEADRVAAVAVRHCPRCETPMILLQRAQTPNPRVKLALVTLGPPVVYRVVPEQPAFPEFESPKKPA